MKNEDDFVLEICPQDERMPSLQQVQVMVSADVIDALTRFAETDLRREQGAMLLGTVSSHGSTTRVVVEAWIEAKYTDRNLASLTFTHHTWEYVAAEQERNYSHLKIVGWFHTHPGFGVFLSSYDLFIHENFFDLPWQIALVCDPIKKRIGCFVWDNEKVQSSQYELFNGTSSHATAAAKAYSSSIASASNEKTRVIPEKPHRRLPREGIIMFFLLGLSLGLLIGRKQPTFPWESRIGRVAIQTTLGNDTVSAPPGEGLLDTNESPVHEPMSPPQRPPIEEGNWILVHVQRGQTLIGIIRMLGISTSKLHSLAEINDLDNINLLRIGQVLKMPIDWLVP